MRYAAAAFAVALGAVILAAPASADNYGTTADAKFFAALGIADPGKLGADTREEMQTDGHKVCSLQRMDMDNATIQKALSNTLGGTAQTDQVAGKIIAAANMAYCAPNGQ
jgi:hypothetical protein